MTKRPELGRDGLYLIAHRDEMPILKLSFPGLRFAIVGSLAITQVAVEQLHSIPASLTMSRVLDRFYLVHQFGNTREQIALEEAFFDLLAEHYEEAIDVENNSHCARQLLGTLTNLSCSVEAPSKILDYGSGTGIASLAAIAQGYRVAAVDASASMRHIATRRGIATFQLKDLVVSGARFDVIMANYVLHLTAALIDLPKVMKLLQLGGIIVANFHKNVGLAQVERMLRHEYTRLAPPRDTTTNHGTIALWRKTSSCRENG